MKLKILCALWLSLGLSSGGETVLKTVKGDATHTFEALLRPGKALQEGEKMQVRGTLQKSGDSFEFKKLHGESVRLDPPPNIGKGADKLVQSYELTKKQGQLELKSKGWEGLEQWKASKDKLPMAKHAAVHQAFADLEGASEKFATSEGLPEHVAEFKQKLATTNEVLAQSYAKAQDPQQKAELVKTYRMVQRHTKATFGRSDNYQPSVYRRIHEHSSAVVAIGGRGRPPEGSGVFIGRNIVLTCNHVMEHAAPDGTDYDVTLDFQDSHTGRAFPIKKVLHRGQSYAGGRLPLDFALLEVADLGAAHPPVPPLSSTRVRLGDAIYVTGHPLGQSKMVHDNAFVLFPFQVKDDELAEIELFVAAETNGSPDAAREVREFKASYLPPLEGQRAFHELFSLRWDSQPTIAADCDTFHGNSGSPASLRNGGQIVGLLFAGEDDIGEAYIPGWNRHEAILPITEIIKQLNLWKSTWAQDYGVTIQ